MESALRPTAVVDTTAGKIRGFWQRDDSAAFLSIPYAQPPVGALRFAAPQPREPWTGVRECVEYGATAQRETLGEVTAIPEPSIPGDDYLTLSVFTPQPGEPTAALPVMVWIHGGGYTAGSPASPWYNGRAFNRDGVVTVTVGYRLGFIGFGALDDAPANRAVLDWIAALEWVRDNIAAFGGDPARVTIAGQSAGGGAVLTLLACPSAQPLFAQAISHSGAPTDIPVAVAYRTADELAARLGIEPTRAAFEAADESKMIAAQTAMAEAVMQGNPTAMLRSLWNREPTLLSFGPVVDGDLVVGSIRSQLSAGVGAGKPLLIGSTSQEFNRITAAAPRAANLLPVSVLLTRAGMSRQVAKAYAACYPGLHTMELVGQFLTETMFHLPLVEAATGHSPSWAFEFAWPSPAAGGTSPHCLDLPFAWDCLDADHVEHNTGPRPPQTLADAMHGAWVRFVTTGDPGWEAYTPDSTATRVFDTPPRDDPSAFAPARLLLPHRP